MGRKSLALRLVTRFRGNKLLSSLLGATGRPLKDHKWVFILGCYNSGTTLVDQILSSHAQFSGLNEEGVMLTDKLPRPEDFQWRRMWWKCEEKMMIPITSGDVIADQVKRHWSHFYNARKPFLIEKSISNTPRALFFEEYFQPAYFVHIVRNGYAVAEGIRRKADVMPRDTKSVMKEYPIEWCASQWNRSIEIVEQIKPRLKHFMEITYEQLTEDPDRVIRDVCDFTGSAHFKESLKGTSFEVHKHTEQIVNMNQRSIKNLSMDQIAAINKVAGPLLRKYGYFISRV